MTIPAITDYPGPQPSRSPVTIGVITTVRNAERTLQRTIDSVRSQALPGMEYIVVDAVSTDRTLDIVRANADVVTHWISEKDRGISDGFNKGIALTASKYVAILNADDWFSPDQLRYGIETLEDTRADFVFGDLIYHDGDGAALYRVRGEAGYASRIRHVMPALNHPSVIVRRSTYESCGLFDTDLRFAMDYELLLRFHCAGLCGVYDPRVVGHMTLEGASDRNARAALREVRDISISHGLPPAKAHLLHGFRLIKGRARRLSEALLPHTAGVTLRHFFNRSLTGLK